MKTFRRLGAAAAAALLLVGCAATMPEGLGPSNGRLAPCPDSPNCVSSFAEDQEHAIEALRYQVTEEAAREALMDVVAAMPDTSLVSEGEDYLHYEFRTRIMRFVDDVEFLFRDGVIHVRSASRVGYSDLGVNRRRVEEIRTRFRDRLGSSQDDQA